MLNESFTDKLISIQLSLFRSIPPLTIAPGKASMHCGLCTVGVGHKPKTCYTKSLSISSLLLRSHDNNQSTWPSSLLYCYHKTSRTSPQLSLLLETTNIPHHFLLNASGKDCMKHKAVAETFPSERTPETIGLQATNNNRFTAVR